MIALVVSFNSILAEDSLAVSSFEAIASSLHQRFNKNEHFQIGSAMVWFLTGPFSSLEEYSVVHLSNILHFLWLSWHNKTQAGCWENTITIKECKSQALDISDLQGF